MFVCRPAKISLCRSQKSISKEVFTLKGLKQSKNVLRASYIPQIKSFSTATGPSPEQAYDDLVEQGKIQDDSIQRNALAIFQSLYFHVDEHEKVRNEKEQELADINKQLLAIKKKEAEIRENTREKAESWFTGAERNFSLFGNLFTPPVATSLSPEEVKQKENLLEQRQSLNLPKGLYVHGGPGSGKTFLMDLFYKTLGSPKKRRVHFNEFMLEVHRSLHKLTKQGYSGDEMMQKCVENIVENTNILCFDEFQVTDIADAMIMKQLFSNLYDQGVLIVITSNREIDELYKNGIQRDLFVPFLEDLKNKYQVIEMNSKTDYRTLLITTAASQHDSKNLYFLNDDKLEVDLYNNLWLKLTQNNFEENNKLRIQGRDVKISFNAKNDDIARFDFFDLCGQPLGPSDYQTIANSFHTVFIDNIPELSLTELNQIRRFITLIDTFYDQHIVVVILASKKANEILQLGDIQSEEDAAKLSLQDTDLLGTADYVPTQANVDEVFAFNRTISRLNEMQTNEYLLKAGEVKKFHRGMSPYRFFTSIGLVNKSKEVNLTNDQVKLIWKRYESNGKVNSTDLKLLLEEFQMYFNGFSQLSQKDFENFVKEQNISIADLDRDSFIRIFDNFRVSSIPS